MPDPTWIRYGIAGVALIASFGAIGLIWTHVQDCKRRQRDMWKAITKIDKGVGRIEGHLGINVGE